MEKYTNQLLDVIVTLLAGITPAALGACVSLMYEKGLTWGDRFARLAVGCIVSWFGQRAMGAIFTVDPFVLQGIGFTIGMIAFKATPSLISAASDAVASIPARIVARFLPPKTDGE